MVIHCNCAGTATSFPGRVLITPAQPTTQRLAPPLFHRKSLSTCSGSELGSVQLMQFLQDTSSQSLDSLFVNSVNIHVCLKLLSQGTRGSQMKGEVAH